MFKSSFKMKTFTVILVLLLSPMLTSSARTAELEPIVDLGAGFSYAVFAGTEIANTGTATKINGDIGTSPGMLITGLTTDQLTAGMTHANDDNAKLVQNDLMMAYNNIKDSENAKAITTNLGGQTLAPGVYSLNLPATITGTLKLDAQGDINAVFIFQVNSTLITEKGSRIELINGAQFSRVFWQVANDVTLGEKTDFKGNIFADTSIFSETDVTVQGRLLAITGGVTLNNTQVDTIEIAPENSENMEIPQVDNPSDIIEDTPKTGVSDVASPQETDFHDIIELVPQTGDLVAAPQENLLSDTPNAVLTTKPNTVTSNTNQIVPVTRDPITLDGAGDTFKVTVDLGAMTFNYDLGTWNPNAHSWVGGGWNAAGFNGSNDQIKVTNESAQPVDVTFAYMVFSPDGGNITGTFTQKSGNLNGIQTGTMHLGPASTANTYLNLQGQPTQIGSTPTKFGSINIQLNSVLP